jgi:hypothetical protein
MCACRKLAIFILHISGSGLRVPGGDGPSTAPRFDVIKHVYHSRLRISAERQIEAAIFASC